MTNKVDSELQELRTKVSDISKGEIDPTAAPGSPTLEELLRLERERPPKQLQCGDEHIFYKYNIQGLIIGVEYRERLYKEFLPHMEHVRSLWKAWIESRDSGLSSSQIEAARSRWDDDAILAGYLRRLY